jgi:hypothetical protein
MASCGSCTFISLVEHGARHSLRGSVRLRAGESASVAVTLGVPFDDSRIPAEMLTASAEAARLGGLRRGPVGKEMVAAACESAVMVMVEG